VSNIGFGNLPFVVSSVLIYKQVLIKSPVKVQSFPDYIRRFISKSWLIKFREQVFVLLFFQCGKEARVEVAKVRWQNIGSSWKKEVNYHFMDISGLP